MTSSFNPWLALHLLTCVLVLGAGCDASSESAASRRADARPLRPLIYTELPGLTPEAAAVRERRLTRQLLHGTEDGERWGRLKPRKNLPVTGDAQALGAALVDAMLTRDEDLWEHAFVSPRSYSSMVHVEPELARKFVDERMGESLPTWTLFDIEHISEAPDGGLVNIFEFRGLELGPGRDVRGRKVKKDDKPIDQYWGNTLLLGVRGTDVVLKLRIPKILRVADRKKAPTMEPILSVASPVIASRSLRLFVQMGLHLKPELLRSQEFAFPMAVGNFWRYRRYRQGGLAADEFDTEASGIDADELLLEIVSIERYGSMWLVQYRASYNDQGLETRERYWLISPRSIYPCNRACVRHIEDLGWLLEHLQGVIPLEKFPLELGASWGEGGNAEAKKRPVRIHEETANMSVPSGKFVGVHTVEARGEVGLGDPFLTLERELSFFVYGQGIIKRELRGSSPAGEKVTVFEELVESRIMP